MKLLLIEDTTEVAQVIYDYFEGSNVELDHAANGTLGLQLALTGDFDCIILDVMLPGIDGITLCDLVRAKGVTTPIIMLTARDTNQDMLTGLRTGADDYIVKPFDLELLEARIEAVLRRSKSGFADGQLVCGSLILNNKTYEVTREGKPISLNNSCFSILKCLMENYPNMVTRQTMEEELWPDDPPDDDVLRKHVYQLRTKLDKPFGFDMLKTVPKKGYKLVVADEAT